jgi:hypothetical protein
VPELKTKEPLDPTDPEFKERINIEPLVDAVPSPLEIVTAPPVRVVLRPAWANSAPPTPLVPLPTESNR